MLKFIIKTIAVEILAGILACLSIGALFVGLAFIFKEGV